MDGNSVLTTLQFVTMQLSQLWDRIIPFSFYCTSSIIFREKIISTVRTKKKKNRKSAQHRDYWHVYENTVDDNIMRDKVRKQCKVQSMIFIEFVKFRSLWGIGDD